MSEKKSPLWKQILGAVVGGSLALLIYAGYQATAPQLSKLTGILVLPQDRINANAKGEVNAAESDLNEEQLKRIASRAQNIATDLSADQAAENVSQDELVEIVPIALPREQEIIDAWGAADTAVESADPVWDESTVEFAEEPNFYGETDELPDSGIGVWLASLIAFAGAAAYFAKKKLTACAANT